MGVAALGNMTALSKRNDAPETASRPFDATRDGFVLGEGGGVVVVESLAHALARGATPIAEIIGGALTADAFHISAPDPTGRGQTRAMTNALRNAGVAPDEIDYIVAHGTATPLNDVDRDAGDQGRLRRPRLQGRDQLAEVDDRPPRRRRRDRLARWPAIGAIRDQVIPPTANLHTPDPECDLDYVPLVARQAKVDTVAVNGFGFGGQNAVAIFRRSRPDPPPPATSLSRGASGPRTLRSPRHAPATARPGGSRVVVADQDRLADRDEPGLVAVGRTPGSRCSSVNDDLPDPRRPRSTVTISPWKAGAR